MAIGTPSPAAASPLLVSRSIGPQPLGGGSLETGKSLRNASESEAFA
jgi:hypothetical protein